MLEVEAWREDYLYWDLEEVARAMEAPRPTAPPGQESLALAWNRWESLVRQGAFFKTLGRVNWRVVPEPPRIPIPLLEEITRLGGLVEAFLRGLEQHLGESEFLRNELGFPACPQEEELWGLERSRPLELMRLDLGLENGKHPRLLEIQVVMGGLGITHALRQTYGSHPLLPGTLPMYEACLWRAWEEMGGAESGLAAVIGAKRSAYRHEHLLLARSLHRGRLAVAPLMALSLSPSGSLSLPDGRKVVLIHRLFRSPGLFRNAQAKAEMILEALGENRIRLLNPWKDVLEDKRILALIHHPKAEEQLGDCLDPAQLEGLRGFVPLTWRATPQRMSQVSSLPTSRRGFYLKKGRSFESRALFHGRKLNLRQWEAACRRARLEGDWVLQLEVPSQPWNWTYLEPSSGTMRSMLGYVRLCPFFFRGSDGTMKLADILITAREESSRVHGASDAVLVVPGAPC